MFCGSCGKATEGDEKVCLGCGASLETKPAAAAVPNVNIQVPAALVGRSVNFYAVSGISAVLVILMFCPWISFGISGIVARSYNPITFLFSFVGDMEGAFGGFGTFMMGLMALIMFLGCIGSLGFLGMFLFKLFTDVKSSVVWGERALSLSGLLAMLAIAFAFIVDMIIAGMMRSSFGASVSGLFSATLVPWIVLAGAAACLAYFMKQFKAEVLRG